MSNLLKTLKDDSLAARKAHNVVGTQVLTTMIGELESSSKRDGKPTTDEDVIKLARKSLESVKEVIRLTVLKNEENMDSIVAAFEAEVPFYEKYIPAQLQPSEYLAEMNKITNNGQQLLPIGQVQKHFKQNFAGRYDGSMVNRIYVQAFPV